MKWRKAYKSPLWRAKSGDYYLLVQKRSGRKSHPTPRYYWKAQFQTGPIDFINGFTGLDYEMSLKKAMTAAKGAVLEAKICDSIDT